MTKPKLNWKSGPPKQGIGWYVASWADALESYRWWSGEWWSQVASQGDTAGRAAAIACLRSPYQTDILHLPKNLNRKQT